MILYISIIFIATLLICGVNLICGSVYAIELGVIKMCLMVVLGVVIAFMIDLVVSAIVMIIPSKWLRGFSKVHKWERKFYDKLQIKKWKDLIHFTIL